MRAVLLAAVSLLLACKGPDRLEHAWEAMDTEFRVVLDAIGRSRASAPPESAFAAVQRESVRLEAVFSDYMERSALAALRGRAGDTLEVSPPELAEVLRIAEKTAFEAEGSFDVTLHALK